MKKNNYQGQLANASSKRDVWRMFAFAMVISNILLSWFVFTADIREKTILYPTGTTKSFWVHGDKVDPVYLEEMGEMFSTWLKNFHKDNVAAQFRKVLEHTDSRVHSDLQAWLSSEEERVIRNEISSSFYPLRMRVNGYTVDVTGRLIGYVGGVEVSQNIRVLRLSFAYTGGKLVVRGFQDGRLNAAGEFVKEDDPVGTLDSHINQQKKTASNQ